MSLRTALQAVAIVVLGPLFLLTLFAMGPIGWLVVGTMLVIGVVQVHRQRAERSPADDGAAYCANCGAEIDLEAYDDDSGWAVDHCTNCGAPIGAVGDAGGSGSAGGTENCPECGAPNGPGEANCTYCGTEL